MSSDCGSTPNVPADPSASQRQWKCSEDGTGSDSKCHSVYDSGCIDSGFLSGANLSSDHFVSEEIKSQHYSDSEADLLSKSVGDECKSYARLDSGVDVNVSLNEQFSNLNLKSVNDLNEPTSKCDVITFLSHVNVPTSASLTTPQITEDKSTSSPAPWQLYFEQDEEGDTQLHIAVIQGFIEVVYSLVRMAPHPCFLDIRNDVCQTPLHLAVLTRQPDIVRRLVLSGANPSLRDRHGNNALHLACAEGDLSCLRALLQPVHVQEADSALAAHVQAPSLEERNYDGLVCVHLAALSGHVDVLRHLVWFGANINAREAKSGRTVLHLAIEYRLTEVLQFLLEDAARGGPIGLQLEAPTYAGLTAYQLASCIDSALADRLADQGAQARAFPEDESSDEEEDEMYRNFPGNYFQELKINGDPINASA